MEVCGIDAKITFGDLALGKEKVAGLRKKLTLWKAPRLRVGRPVFQLRYLPVRCLGESVGEPLFPHLCDENGVQCHAELMKMVNKIRR